MSAFRSLRGQYDGHWPQCSCAHDAPSVGPLIDHGRMCTHATFRVYAMYPSNFYVMGGVFAAFVVELSVNAWLLTHGIGTS